MRNDINGDTVLRNDVEHMWDNEAGNFGLGIVGQRRVPVKVSGIKY